MSSIRVAIVDDQQLVRAGFALVINSQPDMEVVLEAGDGAQAVRLLRSHDVDVVLMDVRMPNMDGLAATEALTAPTNPDGSARRHTPKIVILTTFDLDEYVLQAIKDGASDSLPKAAPPKGMPAATRPVHRGEPVIAPPPPDGSSPTSRACCPIRRRPRPQCSMRSPTASARSSCSWPAAGRTRRSRRSCTWRRRP